jgi:hypothetical protein
MATVVEVDNEGALLHYQAPVEHAAAAACLGWVPGCGVAGGMLVYGPGDSAAQQGLAPGAR